MTETEVTPNTVEQNVGEQLCSARKRANLSLDDVARSLNLSTNQISALEADDYRNLGPTTFVKGYIKSYCKLLQLNENDVLNTFVADENAADTVDMQSFSRRTEREANDNRLMLFSYVVLSIIVGSSIFYWWQNREPSPVLNEVTPQSTEAPIKSEQTIVPTILPTVVNQDAAQQEQVTTENELGEDALNQSELERVVSEPMTNASTDNQQLNTTALQSNENTLPRIKMEFSGDSWVEIFDANGDRIAFGVKKKDYTMRVEGPAPLKVVIGKHHLVTVYYNDEVVDLSQFPTNRLAKFNLPLTE